jgi:hypothetical protein
MYILCVYAIMAPAHESETIVFNFRKLLSTLPNYAELEQILLFSINWGKQVFASNGQSWNFVLFNWTMTSIADPFCIINRFLVSKAIRKIERMSFLYGMCFNNRVKKPVFTVWHRGKEIRIKLVLFFILK